MLCFPVMLRGRYSCTISDRPTPLPTPLYAKVELRATVPLSCSSSVDCRLSAVDCFSPLSPIIPVHPKNSPVTPIIPVHTQKHGGGGLHFGSFGSLTSPPSSPSPLFSTIPLRASAFSASLRYPFLSSLRFSPPATSHSPLSLTIPVDPGISPVTPIIPVHTQKHGGGGTPSDASADNSLVYITDCLLAIKIQNVGAPTYCNWLTTGASTFNGGAPTSLFSPQPLFSAYSAPLRYHSSLFSEAVSCQLSALNSHRVPPPSRFPIADLRSLITSYGTLLATNSQFVVSVNISPVGFTNAPCAKLSACSWNMSQAVG